MFHLLKKCVQTLESFLMMILKLGHEALNPVGIWISVRFEQLLTAYHEFFAKQNFEIAPKIKFQKKLNFAKKEISQYSKAKDHEHLAEITQIAKNAISLEKIPLVLKK